MLQSIDRLNYNMNVHMYKFQFFSGVIYAIVCSTQLPMLQNTSEKFIRGKTNLDASNAKSDSIT